MEMTLLDTTDLFEKLENGLVDGVATILWEGWNLTRNIWVA